MESKITKVRFFARHAGETNYFILSWDDEDGMFGEIQI